MGSVALLAGVPAPAVGQANPPLTAEPFAELLEAKQLHQQAEELYNQGQYAAAIPLAERSLAIYEKVMGPEHPFVANSLNNLAGLYREQGNYVQAAPLFQRSLAILEKVFGPEHPNVATSLNNLALLYNEQGNYAQAEPLYQRALAIEEKVFGPEHPDLATSLNNLADLYREQGNYVQAELLFQRSLAISEKRFGPEHPLVATSLNNLALLYQAMGNYAQVEPLLQRALAIREEALGPEHPDVALSLNNLAALYWEQGNYTQAEPLYQRSLAIFEKVLGPEHLNVAQSLNNLAELYQEQGNYAQAEPLFQRSLVIFEKVQGPEHPLVALSLNNLAVLYWKQGNYVQAEPLYQRSLAISEKVFGPEHPDVALSLNNLANLYQEQGNYAQAEPLYQRSLAIWEKLLGPEHPLVATSLNNLANLYQLQGNYAQAESVFQRSLVISEKVQGSEHPDVAISLNNLANLYQVQGNYTQAEPLYQRSLAIWEKVFGPEHPNVAISLNNLANLYWAKGDIARTLEFRTRSTNIEESNLDLLFTIGSEARKSAYIATLSATNATISLHLQGAPDDAQAARLALTSTLRRKGLILDAVTNNLQTLRQNLKPEDQAILDQLATTRSQLAALIFNKPEDIPLEQYRQQVATLKAQAEQLEDTLFRRSSEFRTKSQPVTIEAIQQLIPADAALVELVLYKPFNPNSTEPDKRWGNPRYVAYILHSTGEPQWVDLGEAAPIHQAVADFRKTIVNPIRRAQFQQVARSLDEKLMQPIRQHLGDTRTLLLSPDSQLNLIPFAALVDETNRYLVETYSISYLSSGRDLLRLQNHAQSRSQPVVVANPDYDKQGDPTSVQIVTNPETSPPTPLLPGEGSSSVPPFPRREGGLGGLGRDNQRSTDIAQLQFDPLLGTAQEAAAIAPLLPGVNLLTGSQATENALKQLNAPGILHIATHGFFLNDVELVAPPAFGSSTLLSERGTLAPQSRPSVPSPTPTGKLENPLLRSGIALAGFNSRSSGSEDGVLTALEAAGLNLSGTKLVVLSACETGLGDATNGEGIYGLRRALGIAGTESQLISLWKVDDAGTKDLMVSYYQRLMANVGRSEALRQTQLEMLQNPTYQHPYYWAAFIPSGDWTSIESE